MRPSHRILIDMHCPLPHANSSRAHSDTSVPDAYALNSVSCSLHSSCPCLHVIMYARLFSSLIFITGRLCVMYMCRCSFPGWKPRVKSIEDIHVACQVAFESILCQCF